MIYIFIIMTFALILGIIISDYVDVYFLSIFILILIIINKPLQKIFKTLKTYYNWIFLAFLAGCIIASGAKSYQMNALYPVDDKFVTLSGYICEIPVQNEDRFSYVMCTDTALYKETLIKARQRVRFSSDVRLDYSQKLEIRGFLTKIDPPGNRSDFNYNLYYKSKGIFYKISDFEIKSYEKEKLFSPTHFVNLFKLKLTDLFSENFSKDDTAVLKAVTTGDKSGFSEEFSNILYDTGIMRMLYPAYLHILLVTLFINIPLFFLKRDTKEKLLISILVIYIFFNFDKGALLKNAILVISVVFTTRVLGYVRYIDALCATVMMILLFNPLIIYQPGFVISVAVSFILFMIKDAVFSSLSFVRNYYLRKFVTFFLIFTIGTSPILAYYFYGMNILTPFLNIIFLPLVAIILILCGIYVFEVSVFGVSYMAENIIKYLLSLFYKIVDVVNQIPFTFIDVERPSFLVMIIFLLFIIGIRLTYLYGIRDTKTKMTLLMLTGFMLAVIVVNVISASGLFITFINVGQGDACLVTLPGNRYVVIDGGGSEEFSDYNIGEEIFIPYLKSEGVYTVDAAIVTHFHKDHCEGIIALLKNMRVKTLIMPFSYEENEYRQELIRLARKQGTKVIKARRKDSINIGLDAKIDIVSPYEREPEEENNSSLVFTLSCNDFTALFTGDATSEIEERFIDDFYDVDLLKVAHHGSDTSTSEEFLKKIKPEAAVISVAKDNMHLLPDDSVIKRLENAGTRIFRTDENGDITFAIYNGKMKVNTFY